MKNNNNSVYLLGKNPKFDKELKRTLLGKYPIIKPKGATSEEKELMIIEVQETLVDLLNGGEKEELEKLFEIIKQMSLKFNVFGGNKIQKYMQNIYKTFLEEQGTISIPQVRKIVEHIKDNALQPFKLRLILLIRKAENPNITMADIIEEGETIKEGETTEGETIKEGEPTEGEPTEGETIKEGEPTEGETIKGETTEGKKMKEEKIKEVLDIIRANESKNPKNSTNRGGKTREERQRKEKRAEQKERERKYKKRKKY